MHAVGFDLSFRLDSTDIAEPIGFRDIQFSITRSPTSHGIGFEASDSALGFYCDAADYLQTVKDAFGLKANVTFTAELSCNGEPRETVIQGRLNFGKWRETCGINGCVIYLPVETTSCELILMSRIENEIDLDKTTTFNNADTLTPYSGLNMPITLPPKNIATGAIGQVADGGEIVDVGAISSTNYRNYSRPSYVVSDGSMTTQELDSPTYEFADSEPGFDFLSPQLLLENFGGRCSTGDFQLDVRMKGNATDQRFVSRNIWLSFVIGKGEFSNVSGTFPTTGGLDIIHQVDILISSPFGAGTQNFGFDESYSGVITLAEGQGLYAYMFFRSDSGVEQNLHPEIGYDEETFFSLTGIQSCPPSNANIYLINETLARVTENISDNCCTVLSTYFGRTDSQPYAFDSDGCGGLRCLTSGLKIRAAADARFFTSLRALLNGLNGIDNLGWDVIPSTGGAYFPPYVLRVEHVSFFYEDREMLRCNAIPESEMTIIQERYYVKIVAGYKKWEVQTIKGAEEINAGREYRTVLDTITNSLDISSELIAGAYAIEITRQQGFAESGNADTSYDDDTFIICLDRGIYGIEVELDALSSETNISDPATLYNARISPARNMLRWLKSVLNSYPTLFDGQYKIFFSSGTGNFRACSMLTDPECRLEAGAICEDSDLWAPSMADSNNATPLWKNERVTFDYPLSVQEYNTIKADPYGYISFQCVDGPFRKGFIEELQYKPADGIATFVLRVKWE